MIRNMVIVNHYFQVHDRASCPRRRASSGGADDGLDSRLRGNDGVAILELLSFEKGSSGSGRALGIARGSPTRIVCSFVPESPTHDTGRRETMPAPVPRFTDRVGNSFGRPSAGRRRRLAFTQSTGFNAVCQDPFLDRR
ncbi:MAG: hypothetical protein WD069_14595 [Planctomycetales bacterium]